MDNGKTKILAVDDNRDNLVVLKVLINEFFPEAKIFTATSGQQGLDLTAREEPDVIVLDIVMPGMDGYEVCRKLKADPILSDIPVVFLTASRGDKESRILALECGAEAFLSKPIDESELIAQIKAMLKIRNAIKSNRNEKERLTVLVDEKTKELRDSNTELKKIEEQLRLNIDDLLESQRVAHVGTWRLDLATNQVVWSEELYKMYGFDPTIPPPPYTEHMKLFTPESWDMLSTSLDRTSTLGIPYELELNTVTKDGSNGWMWVRGEAIKDLNGQIVALRGAAQDITERKKAEYEVKQSEEKFQLLFNKAPLGYQSLDIEGRFLEVNQKWLDTLGYSKEEVIGKWFGDFLCPEYVDGFRQRFPIFKAQGHIHSEFEMLSKDGQRLFIAFDGKVGHDADNAFIQTHCILQDITNQRKAERALEESEERYRHLFEHSGVGILYFTKEGIIISYNKKATENYGWKLEDYTGKSISVAFPTGMAELFFKRIEKATLDDQQQQYEDYMAINPVPKWFSTIITNVKNIAGEVIGIQFASLDITERKQAENTLHKLEERFRIAQELSPDGFTILHPIRNESGEIIDFTWVYENQAVARINHTDPEKVIGKRLLDLFPTHSGTSIYEAYIHVANTGETQILDNVNVGEIVSEPRWLRLAIVSMGEDIAILDQDITERKISEEALLESQSILKAAFENSQAGIAIADAPDGKLRYVNKAGLLIRDKSEEEIVKGIDIQNYVAAWKMHHFDGTPLAVDEVPLARAVLYGEACSDEFIIRRDNFEDRYVLANAVPIKDSNDHVKAGMVVFIDITEKRQAEAQLQQLVDDLRIQNDILTRFNAITVDRELRMIELKREINELCLKQGEPTRYKVVAVLPDSDAIPEEQK